MLYALLPLATLASNPALHYTNSPSLSVGEEDKTQNGEGDLLRKEEKWGRGGEARGRLKYTYFELANQTYVNK